MIAPRGKHHSRRFIPNRVNPPNKRKCYIRNFSVQWSERQLIWSPHHIAHHASPCSSLLHTRLFLRLQDRLPIFIFFPNFISLLLQSIKRERAEEARYSSSSSKKQRPKKETSPIQFSFFCLCSSRLFSLITCGWATGWGLLYVYNVAKYKVRELFLSSLFLFRSLHFYFIFFFLFSLSYIPPNHAQHTIPHSVALNIYIYIYRHPQVYVKGLSGTLSN